MQNKIQHNADKPTAPDAPGTNRYRISTHRSMHRLALPRSRLAVILFLPLAFNTATWWARDAISAGWKAFFEFWITELDIAGTVTLKTFGPGWLDLALPYLDLPSSSPDALTWWVTLIMTIIALLLSSFTPDNLLPLRYLVRVAAFIQITSLLFFAIVPAAFPYTVSGYTEDSLAAGAGFILIIPWVHALVYYIFDFPLLKKAGLTLLTIAFITIALPFQLMAHAYLLVKFSLLFLPLLYLIFGIMLLTLACIALYGWAMSWKHD